MGQQIRISTGNSKMGKVAHINLPPCMSCDKTLPCYREGCYAHKAYRMYPNVREAWGANWLLAKLDPKEYFVKINEWISRRPKLDMFRWHSAGDIIDRDYLVRMIKLAKMYPTVKFLVFTKKFQLVADVIDRRKPLCKGMDNLNIVLSAWPGLTIDPKLVKRFPVAYMRDRKDPLCQIPSTAIECTGKCDTCGKCWLLEPGESVVFDKH